MRVQAPGVAVGERHPLAVRGGAAPTLVVLLSLGPDARARGCPRPPRALSRARLFVSWALASTACGGGPGAEAKKPSAGPCNSRAGWSTADRARPPARRGTGAVAPPSKVRGPRDASPESLPRRPTAGGPRAGEGTRKPQRQKTYTLRSDKDLRACRSDFDPRPGGMRDGPVLAAQRGLIRRAVALATVYIKVGRTTI